MNLRMYFAIILLLTTLGYLKGNTQTFQCRDVAIDMAHLQSRDQEDLNELPGQIQNYINAKDWSDEKKDILITCNVRIIVETVNTQGFEKIYRVKYLISSPSGENFFDEACEFNYVPGQGFETYRTQFDPLLALVDFYGYMVLAGEMDTFELMGGSAFYDQALDIANQGQLSNYPLGWGKRQEEVQLITDGQHVPLREAKFYYYEGLYFIERRPEPGNARQFSKAVVDRLAQVHNTRPNSKALKRFFDSHYQEFCKLFQFDLNRGNVERMANIDSRHREAYENCEIGT
ncbi:MAG: DUF4835 family protein [Calditrichia bacterium]